MYITTDLLSSKREHAVNHLKEQPAAPVSPKVKNSKVIMDCTVIASFDATFRRVVATVGGPVEELFDADGGFGWVRFRRGQRASGCGWLSGCRGRSWDCCRRRRGCSCF